MSHGTAADDIVRTHADAAANEREPLVVLEPLRAFLDAHGLGDGDLTLEPIGEGHSNVTYRVARADGTTMVLRRPPRGPLPPSAHDVLREARLLTALQATPARVPSVLAVGDDVSVIGAPFYVMAEARGEVITSEMPAALDTPQGRAAIADELIDALVEVHAVDWQAVGLEGFGKPTGYLERQLRRFTGLWEFNKTRELPVVEEVGEWLARNLPESPPATIVHGDYRLGNVMYAPAEPRLVAVLDWEMATIGDPLADLGYMTAMWAETDDPPNPVGDLSEVTRLPGFATRAELVARYAEATGLGVEALPWYQVLALWKAAIFLEGSYRRYQAGTSALAYFAGLGAGVEKLGRLAAERAGLPSS